MHIQAYLFFNGRAEEAAEFYRSALNAEVETLLRFKENPAPEANPPGSGEKVMHMCLRIGDSRVMASDGMCDGTTNFGGFSLAITARDEAQAEKLFAALGDGGEVQMPLAKTFFSPRFGMVADRFGVSWMVVVDPQGQQS